MLPLLCFPPGPQCLLTRESIPDSDPDPVPARGPLRGDGEASVSGRSGDSRNTESCPCKSSLPTPPQPCHPPCNVWALDPSDPEVQRSPWRPGFGQRCLGSAFWAPSGPLTCQPLPRPTAPPSNAPPCSVFPLQVFLPALILQAPSIISSGDLALTKPGMNLFSWSESPKPGSVKFGYQLDMSTGEGRRRNPRYQVRGHILTVEPATMSCTSAGCPPAAPSSLWGSV